MYYHCLVSPRLDAAPVSFATLSFHDPLMLLAAQNVETCSDCVPLPNLCALFLAVNSLRRSLLRSLGLVILDRALMRRNW